MRINNYEDKTFSRLSKIFSIYVVLLPILQFYKSPVSTFNMATFLAVVFFPAFLIARKGKISVFRNLLPISIYVVYITFNVLYTSFLYNHPFNMVYDGAYLRMMLLFVSLLYLGQYWFDVKFAIQILEILLIASALFMIIQLGLYYITGNLISGKISALLTVDGYINIRRATGLYMEPAQYSQSATLYLSFKLFAKEPIIHVRKIILIMSGIIMSGSGQGYLYLALVVVLFLFEYSKKLNSRKLRNILIFLGVMTVVGVVALQIPYFQFALERIMPSSSHDFIGGSALQGRTYTNKYYMLLSDVEKRWGVGFGLSQSVIPSTEDAYVNTLYVHLIECGYLSIAIWAFMLIYYFINGSSEIKRFILIYTVMLYFTGMGRPMMICYFFSFILSQSRMNCIKPKQVLETTEYTDIISTA